ncbi:NADH-ubiquinone oxidoreductase-F iron-sulfur binding region domain-containing protein [Thermodesulfovibrio yellowstonii]|nr:NADH-ubiquinone oxidoreductase-F iron-sulfur binding region domain-containing protein [Thermodesulfovibrio islandicus]
MIEFFLSYAQENSCAECIPCRIGTKRMQEIVKRIFDGSVSTGELSLLEDFAEDIGASSKCDLGKMAGKAVKFALQYCKDDIDAHLKGSCGRSIPANPGWQTVMLK